MDNLKEIAEDGEIEVSTATPIYTDQDERKFIENYYRWWLYTFEYN
jgi:hypothetical protein